MHTFCVCKGDVCLLLNPEKTLPALEGGAPESGKFPSEVAGRPPTTAPERKTPAVVIVGVASIIASSLCGS